MTARELVAERDAVGVRFAPGQILDGKFRITLRADASTCVKVLDFGRGRGARGPAGAGGPRLRRRARRRDLSGSRF